MRSCEEKRVGGINSSGVYTQRRGHTYRRITIMNTVNTALFILVWTFTAVCRADKDFNVTCDNVSGFVGKEVNLTCKVSLQNTVCYIQLYKFRHPNDSTICKEVFPKELREQRNSIITCSYTPTTAMTERFRFSVQATCGQKTTEFTVNIADSLLRKTEDASKDAVSGDAGSKNPAISAAVGFFSILLVIITIITIICKTKPNFTRACGLQKRMFLCIRHDEDTSDHTEDVI